MISVEIDANSGFCGGVIKAISAAESYLSQYKGTLYSLGAIVHNEEELSRLSSLGLKSIDNLDSALSKDIPILIRAHGEPPHIYAKAKEKGYSLIDCTCPVVLKLQKDIREAYSRLLNNGGSIVIYGKQGHPEVLGLVGQTAGGVKVAEDVNKLRKMVEGGELRTDRDIELFSQTTMSPDGYKEVSDYLTANIKGSKLTVHNTICSQVANRHSRLVDFAHKHDVIVFVAGVSSSNGKVLSQLCLKENPRTHLVGGLCDLEKEWFRDGDRVGVCGATSTPKWLLEDIAKQIESLV